MDIFLIIFWISITLILISGLLGAVCISRDLILEDAQEELEDDDTDEEYILIDVTMVEAKTKKKNRNQ